MIKKLKNKIINYLFLQIQDLQRKKEQQQLDVLLKSFKSSGKSFVIGKDYSIKNPQYISFGDNFFALDRFRIEAWDNYQNQNFNPEIIIGNNVVFNTDIHIGCIDKIVINDNCLFGSRIFISDHDHGGFDALLSNIPPVERKLTSKGPVIIQKNVWIGEGVCILANVTIGENSIIASNAVVTKDVPANSIVAGIPARVIKEKK
ncbi:acyltransferase [Flavobacterium sp. F372]|uniref:Acyltransferase n=1 Tax=Flavobacterium bernardetii TaxID=2813823 RepID=A0ABR7IU81_9FLAO|nr:acyltransferase [Flavobacterium bernardetii]MBC5833321.1 acyltransferase [Flavobacterium bernardetii]NHF68553.1 acyltransferase [Flavobacterium bernardetii]